MAKLVVASVIDLPVERVWQAIRSRRLLDHVAAPLLSFVPERPDLPPLWQEGEVVPVGMRLFGVLPLGRQTIRISFPPPDPAVAGERRMHDDGDGTMARRWNHLIVVAPLGPERTAYRDEVEIEAGMMTPFVWLFAQLFFRHRQRRWRRLARDPQGVA